MLTGFSCQPAGSLQQIISNRFNCGRRFGLLSAAIFGRWWRSCRPSPPSPPSPPSAPSNYFFVSFTSSQVKPPPPPPAPPPAPPDRPSRSNIRLKLNQWIQVCCGRIPDSVRFQSNSIRFQLASVLGLGATRPRLFGAIQVASFRVFIAPEQLQCNFRAFTGQLQSNSSGVPVPFQCHSRAV